MDRRRALGLLVGAPAVCLGSSATPTQHVVEVTLNIDGRQIAQHLISSGLLPVEVERKRVDMSDDPQR